MVCPETRVGLDNREPERLCSGTANPFEILHGLRAKMKSLHRELKYEASIQQECTNL